jgi:hypothetical protein
MRRVFLLPQFCGLHFRGERPARLHSGLRSAFYFPPVEAMDFCLPQDRQSVMVLSKLARSFIFLFFTFVDIFTHKLIELCAYPFCPVKKNQQELFAFNDDVFGSKCRSSRCERY